MLTVNEVEVLFQNGFKMAYLSSDIGKLDFFFWRAICVTGHTVVVHIVMIIIETFFTQNFSAEFGEVA